MEAYLWDGRKNIKGELTFLNRSLRFVMHDFADTNLALEIDFDSLISVKGTCLYNISHAALEFTSADGKKNVFVFEHEGDMEEVRSRVK